MGIEGAGSHSGVDGKVKHGARVEGNVKERGRRKGEAETRAR